MKAHGWKTALYSLLVLQVLAIGLFMSETFFGFRKLSAFVPPLGLAALAFLGLLLWCVESVHARPELTRFALRGILVSFLLWCVTPFFLPFRVSEVSTKRRADITRIFQELVAEGKVPAPVPAEVFKYGSRDGGISSIRYKNAVGEDCFYIVTEKYESFWSFQNPADRSEIRKPIGYR